MTGLKIPQDENLTKEQKLIQYPPRTSGQWLIWEVFFMCNVLIAVAFFGEKASRDVTYTWIISIIFGINIIIRFFTINQKGDWIFFIFGVIAGGGNDLLSMIKGVYNYTSITIIPVLTGLMPLWVILYWGQIILLFRKIFNLPMMQGEKFQKNGRYLHGWVDYPLIFDFGLAIILRLIIFKTYNSEPWIATTIYFAGVLFRFLIFPPKRNEWMCIAVLPYAFIFEGLLITFGLYEYYNPIFLGMPGWLYFWWVFLVPFFVKELFDRIEFLLDATCEKRRTPAPR